MKKVLKFWWIIPLFVALLFCYSTAWVLDTYDSPSFEQILFHITEPIAGTESALLYDFFKQCVLTSVIETVVFSFARVILIKKLKSPKKEKIINGTIFVISIVITIICLYLLGFFEFLARGNQESSFIEDNYVNPRNVQITFPKNKRNLIYIFVESLESSYLSFEEGGLLEENLMPELTTLAKENVSFSGTEKLGGAYQLDGTSWTTSAMIAHTAGIPLKLGKSISNSYKISNFLNGIYNLGDILFFEDYNQTIMFGSDGDFGNRKKYFENHGFYTVSDYYDAIEKGKIPEDYLVWWGYEDSKLFEYAKEEALRLSQEDEPFNLSLLTVNTHHTDGYLEDSCPKRYDSQYENVIACTSFQINEFIEWCEKQEFYENTTIIIAGDHLTMKSGFFKLSLNDNRRVFNTIINPAIEPINTTNRMFSTMDMFPTTLAALGATIEGNRLGLGTNLFSDEKTLIEIYGFEEVNKNISYKSEFYNEKILGLDN